MNQMMTAPTEDFIPTRYSLLSRLQNREDQNSWKDFFETYWRLIYSIALKSGLTDAEAQDVVQETIICVARDIEKFKRDRSLGSFKGWLRNITRWRIADQLRKRKPEFSAEMTLENEIPAEAQMEKVWDDEWQSNLMKAAVERIKKSVKEEHFQIFELNVLRQWPAQKVAQTLHVNVAQVYLIKHRILLLIKKEARKLEKQW